MWKSFLLLLNTLLMVNVWNLKIEHYKLHKGSGALLSLITLYWQVFILFYAFPSPAINMKKQINAHICRTNALEMRYIIVPHNGCRYTGEEESGGTVLTHNAEGWNSPGQARGTLLANLGAVSQVQTAQQLPNFLLIVHMLQTNSHTHAHTLIYLCAYLPVVQHCNNRTKQGMTPFFLKKKADAWGQILAK